MGVLNKQAKRTRTCKSKPTDQKDIFPPKNIVPKVLNINNGKKIETDKKISFNRSI